MLPEPYTQFNINLPSPNKSYAGIKVEELTSAVEYLSISIIGNLDKEKINTLS